MYHRKLFFLLTFVVLLNYGCLWSNTYLLLTQQTGQVLLRMALRLKMEETFIIFNIFIFKMYWRMLVLKIENAISQLSTLWRREWGVFACSLIGMEDTDHHLLGEDDKNQTVILLTPFTLSIYLGLWRYESGLPIADILSSQQWFSVSEFLNFFHTWDHHTVMTKLNFGKKEGGQQFTQKMCWVPIRNHFWELSLVQKIKMETRCRSVFSFL